MSQVFTGEETVIKNVALLLQTGRFSDLTLVCKDRRFRVHRAIVCSRSPVWAAAAEGGFKVSTTPVEATTKLPSSPEELGNGNEDS